MKQAVKAVLWGLLLLWLLMLLRITVFRSDFGQHPLFRDGQILWVPFVSLFRILRNSLSFFLYLFVGNLVWFVPLGFLLPVLTELRGRVLLVGLGLSLAIEAGQFVFGTGVTEVEDLILNTLGTGIGYGIYRIWNRTR